MIIIVCIDERQGMMFNHRRQSRDSVVCKDILQECRGKKLYLTPYSSHLFEETGEEEVIISENIMQEAEKDSFCFIEDTDISGKKEQIQKVVLYQWNRHYPADTYFPLELDADNWKMLERKELEGSSHRQITKEVYHRRRDE